MSAVGWQTVWVTGAGTGVGVDAAARALELPGMSKVFPTGILFGETSGFAALNSSCEILNCSASSLNVSPDFIVYTKGVALGTGASTMTSTLGVGVRLGVVVRYGLGDLLNILRAGAGAQAVTRKMNNNDKLRIR